MSNPNIALIGSGPICHHHVPILESVGINVGAVASMNPDSQTVEDFAQKYNIDHAYKGDSWREMIDNGWDGIVIATHVDGIAEALEHSLTADVPILVEKPVAWDSDTIKSLRERAHAQVIVNYHRRYYRPIQKAKEFLSTHRPVMATLELPETDDTIRAFLRKSCHGIDKLRYLFGEITVLDSHELRDDGDLLGFTATLRSEDDDLINVIANWKAPSNKGLDLDHRDIRFQVEPYEQARKYQGFRIEEATEETPFKQYIPQEIETINLESIDKKHKPGFHQQSANFKELVTKGTRAENAATLQDAQEVIRLCEQMLPERLPEKDL